MWWGIEADLLAPEARGETTTRGSQADTEPRTRFPADASIEREVQVELSEGLASPQLVSGSVLVNSSVSSNTSNPSQGFEGWLGASSLGSSCCSEPSCGCHGG